MKNMTLLIIALVASSTAWASKARLEALGQNARGSEYILDQRNIFLNPAHINNVAEGVTLEWGNNANAVDATATPKAEGGFLIKGDYLRYGTYLGNEDEDIVTLRQTANGTLLLPDNTLDLFFGSGGGRMAGRAMQWGANLSYSKNDQEAAVDRNESTVILRGGVVLDENIEAYAHLNLVDQADGATVATQDYKGSLGVLIGGAYHKGNATYFGHYGTAGAEYDNSGTKTDIDASELVVGMARKKKLGEDKMFFYSLAYEDGKIAQKNGTNDLDQNSYLPLTAGIEAKTNSWLALRGSVSQRVLINTVKSGTGAAATSSSLANTTSVAGGMSLYFDQFRMDGSFTTSAGQLNANNLMSRVSMNYTF